MSFKIVRNKIYLTRRDTARFSVGLAKIPGVTQDYQLSEADDVYFIVTDSPEVVDIKDLDTPGSCLFYKRGLDIVIEPEDTKDLTEDMYYHHTRVILAESGDTNTIIDPTEFYLTPEEER